MTGGHDLQPRADRGAQQAVAEYLSKRSLPLNLLLAHNWESLSMREHLARLASARGALLPERRAQRGRGARAFRRCRGHLRRPAAVASLVLGIDVRRRTSPRMHPYSPPPPCPPMYAPLRTAGGPRPRPVRSATAAAGPYAAFDERPYAAPAHPRARGADGRAAAGRRMGPPQERASARRNPPRNPRTLRVGARVDGGSRARVCL